MKNATIQAEQVKATNCILVQGLETQISRDMVELYFENKRKSGGGPVSDVEIDEENKALVYFEEWTSKDLS